jgi:selenocysteine lyase/cysteine desulfurase
MPLLPSQRSLFDIPHDVAYFNCAYHGPQLNEARSRLIAGVTANSHPWKRTPASFFEDAETIRRLVADLFGGDVDGYATIPSVSYGMSTAARALEGQLGHGDSVLTIAEEFPSTVLTWRRVTQTTGATLRVVPTPGADTDWTTAILNHIDAGTRVVSISTCHWTNGAHIDFAAIGRASRASHCARVIDATQKRCAVPF